MTSIRRHKPTHAFIVSTSTGALFSDNSARLSEYPGNKTCSMALKVVQWYLHLLIFSADQLCDVHSAYSACIGQVQMPPRVRQNGILSRLKQQSGANFVCPATIENFFPFKHEHFFFTVFGKRIQWMKSMLQID